MDPIAAVVIQSQWKCHFQRSRFLLLRAMATKISSVFRGYRCRKCFSVIVEEILQQQQIERVDKRLRRSMERDERRKKREERHIRRSMWKKEREKSVSLRKRTINSIKERRLKQENKLLLLEKSDSTVEKEKVSDNKNFNVVQRKIDVSLEEEHLILLEHQHAVAKEAAESRCLHNEELKDKEEELKDAREDANQAISNAKTPADIRDAVEKDRLARDLAEAMVFIEEAVNHEQEALKEAHEEAAQMVKEAREEAVAKYKAQLHLFEAEKEAMQTALKAQRLKRCHDRRDAAKKLAIAQELLHKAESANELNTAHAKAEAAKSLKKQISLLEKREREKELKMSQECENKIKKAKEEMTQRYEKLLALEHAHGVKEIEKLKSEQKRRSNEIEEAKKAAQDAWEFARKTKEDAKTEIEQFNANRNKEAAEELEKYKDELKRLHIINEKQAEETKQLLHRVKQNAEEHFRIEHDKAVSNHEILKEKLQEERHLREKELERHRQLSAKAIIDADKAIAEAKTKAEKALAQSKATMALHFEEEKKNMERRIRQEEKSAEKKIKAAKMHIKVMKQKANEKFRLFKEKEKKHIRELEENAAQRYHLLEENQAEKDANAKQRIDQCKKESEVAIDKANSHANEMEQNLIKMMNQFEQRFKYEETKLLDMKNENFEYQKLLNEEEHKVNRLNDEYSESSKSFHLEQFKVKEYLLKKESDEKRINTLHSEFTELKLSSERSSRKQVSQLTRVLHNQYSQELEEKSNQFNNAKKEANVEMEQVEKKARGYLHAHELSLERHQRKLEKMKVEYEQEMMIALKNQKEKMCNELSTAKKSIEKLRSIENENSAMRNNLSVKEKQMLDCMGTLNKLESKQNKMLKDAEMNEIKIETLTNELHQTKQRHEYRILEAKTLIASHFADARGATAALADEEARHAKTNADFKSHIVKSEVQNLRKNKLAERLMYAAKDFLADKNHHYNDSVQHIDPLEFRSIQNIAHKLNDDMEPLQREEVKGRHSTWRHVKDRTTAAIKLESLFRGTQTRLHHDVPLLRHFLNHHNNEIREQTKRYQENMSFHEEQMENKMQMHEKEMEKKNVLLEKKACTINKLQDRTINLNTELQHHVLKLEEKNFTLEKQEENIKKKDLHLSLLLKEGRDEIKSLKRELNIAQNKLKEQQKVGKQGLEKTERKEEDHFRLGTQKLAKDFLEAVDKSASDPENHSVEILKDTGKKWLFNNKEIKDVKAAVDAHSQHKEDIKKKEHIHAISELQKIAKAAQFLAKQKRVRAETAEVAHLKAKEEMNKIKDVKKKHEEKINATKLKKEKIRTTGSAAKTVSKLLKESHIAQNSIIEKKAENYNKERRKSLVQHLPQTPMACLQFYAMDADNQASTFPESVNELKNYLDEKFGDAFVLMPFTYSQLRKAYNTKKKELSNKNIF
eukprot:g1021.t1